MSISRQDIAQVMYRVVVAEWLRRWTRNPLGSSRAGSNPSDNAYLLQKLFIEDIEHISKTE